MFVRPHEDKLTLTFFDEPQGEAKQYWIGRTVIR
jgi:hypothetical protein